MRNFFIIMSLCVVIILQGCYQHIPSRDYNKASTSYYSDINQQGSNTKSQTKKYFPIECRDESFLTGDILSADRVISIYKNMKTINEKSEFETDAEYKDRFDKLRNQSGKKYAIILEPMNGIIYQVQKFTYDINSESFKITFNTSLGLKMSSRLPAFGFLLKESDGKESSYTGTNAFGVSTTVSKFKKYKIVILPSEYDNLPTSDVIFESCRIDRDEAQKVKKDLVFVVEFEQNYFYDKQKKIFVSTDNVSRHSAPTMTLPVEMTYNYNILYAKINALYIIDKKTKRIYGGVTFK